MKANQEEAKTAKNAKKATERDFASEYVSKSTVCQMFGIGARRVEQLISDGVIDKVKEKNKVKFDLVDTVSRYIEYIKDKAEEKNKSAAGHKSEIELKAEKLEAEIALKNSQAELHELRTQIAKGEYVSVDEVQMDYERFFVVFKKFAESVPSRTAGILNGVVDPIKIRQIEDNMQEEITGMLRDFVLKAYDSENGEKPDEPGKHKKAGRQKKSQRAAGKTV